MPSLLVVKDLSKTYVAGLERCSARVHVLRGVSFSLSPGERLAVVGGPATGKTTLLYCLAGLRRADAGQIRWNRRAGVASVREICSHPGRAGPNERTPLLIDLSEHHHSIVEWAEWLREGTVAPAGWILVARRLGPIAHLCHTVGELEGGLLNPRASAPITRRVAEAFVHATNSSRLAASREPTSRRADSL